MLPFLVAPYFFLGVPFSLLNIYIVYRIAKDCPGVWYHFGQAIGDLGAMFFGLISNSLLDLVFAPLFAWTIQCQWLSTKFFLGIKEFFILLSFFGFTLLSYDRYRKLCYPVKSFTESVKARMHMCVAAVLSVVPGFISFSKYFLRYYPKAYNIIWVLEAIIELLYHDYLYQYCDLLFD